MSVGGLSSISYLVSARVEMEQKILAFPSPLCQAGMDWLLFHRFQWHRCQQEGFLDQVVFSGKILRILLLFPFPSLVIK